MYNKTNIFDKIARPFSLLMLLAIPIVIITIFFGPVAITFGLMFLFLTFGISSTAQAISNIIQQKIKDTFYLLHIPCTITDYVKKGESSLSEYPILTPLDAQYTQFQSNQFILKENFPIGSIVEVCFTPEINLEDHFILNVTKRTDGKGMLIIGILFLIATILTPVISNYLGYIHLF